MKLFKNYTSVSIISHSEAPSGKEMVTFLIKMPNIIVKHLLRHRSLSFSSSSVRAMPFRKQLWSMWKELFVPQYWQKSHNGMQGYKYHGKFMSGVATFFWVLAAFLCSIIASVLNILGITKQLSGRIIEPFTYTTLVVSGTEWENFFELRSPIYSFKDGDSTRIMRDRVTVAKASGIDSEFDLLDPSIIKSSTSRTEIHMQIVAEMMAIAVSKSEPYKLVWGDWHVPFIDNESSHKIFDYCISNDIDDMKKTARKHSVACCARTSFKNHLGNIDMDSNMSLFERLVLNNEMSPLEHIAQVQRGRHYNLTSFSSMRYKIEHNEDI